MRKFSEIGGRFIGIDIVRTVAIFSVIAGHFWVLNTPYCKVDFDGSFSMFVQGMGYFFFAIGVPLFLLMTGYLNYKKVTFDKKYLKGILKVIYAYLFFSALTYLFRTYYLHENIGIIGGIKKTLDFSLIPYAWYIEMWIGLYLITPFLNLGYQAISNRDQKKVLILLLYLMTALPNFCNRHGMHLVPSFWSCLYPIMFFMIGRYVREYNPKCSLKVLGLAALLPCLINPLFSTFVVSGRPLMLIAGNSSSGLFGTIQAVAVFLLLYKLDIQNGVAKWCVNRVALLSLDIYLACYMVDQLVYPIFISHFYQNQQQFGCWFFVIAPLILVVSAILAQVKEWIFKAMRLA